MFSNIECGSLIFQKWVEELGKDDKDNRIRVGIIKGFEKKNPLHYKVLFTEDVSHTLPKLEQGYFVFPCRFCIMEPQNNINLSNFIKHINITNLNYFLAPAVINPKTSSPEILFEYIIKKSSIEIKEAWEVGEDSWLSFAITADDDPVIPATIQNPPVTKLLNIKKNLMK